jgi:hypothetical protein
MNMLLTDILAHFTRIGISMALNLLLRTLSRAELKSMLVRARRFKKETETAVWEWPKESYIYVLLVLYPSPHQ